MHLSTYAKALSVLLESINTSLTGLLVQQGVLEDKGDNPVEVKNEVRTKPTTPIRTRRRSRVEAITLSFTVTSAPGTFSPVDINPTPSSVNQTAIDTDTIELEGQYKPKGGIYGNDNENDDTAAKDEVDLVMEVSPGEIDARD
ncbi:hypothetical protein BGZ96_000402 [Linnemannia gamsii]|uniref:Uncharacterized protein n=1 Tax=Linnemannia gamsii TaxID=64522 RepID=A0ABQ7KBI3_9FUNG|nr:hypothetical protein BGZ96_000402 [Linnemannia gamsii]